MLRSLELLVAMAGLVLGVMQLAHTVGGVGPSPVGIAREVVIELPGDFEVDDGDIPSNIEEFDRQFEERKEDLFPDGSRTPPTPPEWFDDEPFEPTSSGEH